MGKEEVGKRIKEARLKRSMSQTRLAELVGYKDKTAISKIESGRFDIPQTKLVAIAEALGGLSLLGIKKAGAPKDALR